MARLHDSASHLAMAAAKTQLSTLCTQSLLYSLPWSLASAAWNMLTTQVRLLMKTAENSPFLFLQEFQLCMSVLLFLPIKPPRLPWFWSSDVLMHRSLRCGCGQLGIICWVADVKLVVTLRGEIPEKFFTLPCFWHLRHVYFFMVGGYGVEKGHTLGWCRGHSQASLSASCLQLQLFRHSCCPSALNSHSTFFPDLLALLHGTCRSLKQGYLENQLQLLLFPFFYSELWLCMAPSLFLPIYPPVLHSSNLWSSDAQISQTCLCVGGCYLLSL